jgi:Fur family ferric uptake transcriptional regulator
MHCLSQSQLVAESMSCGYTLKQNGFRLTPQRRMILDVIHEANGHLTADEIIDYVQARVEGVNKSTIYRTLELLEGLGCVYRTRLGDHFIYHHAEGGHHHHVVCRVCGKSVDLDDDLFESVERAVSERSGFQVGFTHVVMRGLCAECAEREAKGEGCN